MNSVSIGWTIELSRWRQTALALALLELALLLVYRDTVTAMVGIWARSESFTHAFVVLPLGLWLVWRRREALLAHAPQPSAWPLLALAAMALLWLLGELAAVNAATQFALVAMLILAVPALTGTAAARSIAFPLAFLLFAVPIGDFLVPQMMLWTADFAVAALRATGIPVYREGQQLFIPSGTWSVVEACSGVRYLMASMMVGTLFAYLNYRSLARRLAFVGVAIAVPIVANWLRAYLTILLGHVTNNELAVGADHLVYGWLFFGVVIVLMFVIGARWAEPRAAPVAAVVRAPAQPARTPWTVASAAALLMLAPLLVEGRLDRLDTAGPPAFTPLAGIAAPWRAADAGVAWRAQFRGASTVFERGFAAPQFGRVGLQLAYYRHQDYAHKLVDGDSALLAAGEKEWLRTASASRTLDIDGRRVTFRTASLRRFSPTAAERRLAVWYAYWVDGTLTPSGARAKLEVALQRLLGRGDDAALLVLYAPETEGEITGTIAIEGFLRANLPALEAQLRATRANRAVEPSERGSLQP
jgi:exosortase A